jgi:hypothetical protein
MRFHTCGIYVLEGEIHVNELFPLHACVCLKVTVSLLGVVPYGMNDLGGGQDREAQKGVDHTCRRSDVCLVVETWHRSNQCGMGP